MIWRKRTRRSIGLLMWVIFIAAFFLADARSMGWKALVTYIMFMLVLLTYGLLTGIAKYFE